MLVEILDFLFIFFKKKRSRSVLYKDIGKCLDFKTKIHVLRFKKNTL